MEPKQLVSACSRVCTLSFKGRKARPSRLLHQPTLGLLVQAWRARLSNVHAHTGPLLLICCQSELKQQEPDLSELRQQDERLETGVQARRRVSKPEDERPGLERSVQARRRASKSGDEPPGLKKSLWDWGRASGPGDERPSQAWRQASKPGLETSIQALREASRP